MTRARGGRATRTAVIAACAVLAAGVVAGCGSDWDVDPATESVLSSTAVVPEVTATSTVSASAVTDTSDLANLMAIATHVFTGRVDAPAGTTALDAIPETQYRVRTSVSVKGSVPGEVVVNQQGGITDRVYYSVNGDTPLTVGQWYLFATRYLEAQNWYYPHPGRRPHTGHRAAGPRLRLTTAGGRGWRDAREPRWPVLAARSAEPVADLPHTPIWRSPPTPTVAEVAP